MVYVMRHKRITRNGVSSVREHERKYHWQPSKPFKVMPKSTFELPIETAVYVPSTDKQQNFIGEEKLKERTEETENQLGKLFGGFTKVEGLGGYAEKYQRGKKKGMVKRMIKERVNKVTSFAELNKFKRNNRHLKTFVNNKKEDWGQLSMGVETEGNLYYV